MAPTWWRRWSGGGARTSDHPTSSNRASSFHLRWGGLPGDAVLVSAAATLEVLVPPAVEELYFWALQVSFTGGARRTGGAHLGLQWHPAHPGARAVNWGGYAEGGGELTGSPSPWPSATGNPNTRDLAWRTGHPHRLVVAAGERPGAWVGAVDGAAVRELDGGGDRLGEVMVWSEVFARCDDPSVVVRWSGFEAVDVAGQRHRPDRVTLTYQATVDGGCDNTDVLLDGDGVLQVTNRPRSTPAGSTLAL